MTDAEFLAAVRAYIEEVEVQIEGEWGISRGLEELIAAGEMPALYTEVLRRVALAEPTIDGWPLWSGLPPAAKDVT